MKTLLSTTALVAFMTTSGIAFADDNWHGKGGHDGPPPFEEALSKLPEKDATQFRDTMKASHDNDKALFDQMHKLHEDLRGILTAEKFDKAAYVAKNKELGKLHDKMHDHMTEAFATAVGKLSQDERKTLADNMGHGHHHGHHHHDGEDKAKGDSDSDKPTPAAEQ